MITMYFISKAFYNIAVAKGYPLKRYLWMTFFLGIIGMLFIIALPDQGSKRFGNPVLDKVNEAYGNIPEENISDKQRNAIPSMNEWKCPKCGKINQNYVGTCGCGERKP